MSAPEDQRYMNAQEAAEYLRLSLSWLRKLTCRAEIPYIKVGHRVIYDREDLDEFMEQKKAETTWRRRS